jgi:hypothetical protein
MYHLSYCEVGSVSGCRKNIGSYSRHSYSCGLFALLSACFCLCLLLALIFVEVDCLQKKCHEHIDIESLQNRLLKVCYVPSTRAGLRRVSFFFSFLFLLLQPLTVLMKQTRQAVCAIKQSIILDVYA